jgi:hypothetical protein
MEVAVFADGRFTAITDICFLFWWVEIGAKGETSHLAPGRTILKYVHVNDCLVVYTSRIDADPARAQQVPQIHSGPLVTGRWRRSGLIAQRLPPTRLRGAQGRGESRAQQPLRFCIVPRKPS